MPTLLNVRVSYLECMKKLQALFARPHSFVPLFQACICTENPLTDCWSAVLIWSLHQSPDCRIGNETVKLLLSGRQHQILFSFYYLSDLGPTFADKTISLHIIIWNTPSLDCILPLLLLFSLPGNMQSRELYFKNHKNARHISASGRWLTARTRNNSSTWLPSTITPEKSGSHSPPCTNTQHEIVLFITSCTWKDLLFLRLTGATQVLQNFLALKRKLKVHLFKTEEINFVCADQRTQDKVRNTAAFSPRFIQVPVKATHMLIYKKRKSIFF